MFIDIHTHTRFYPVMPRSDGSTYATPLQLQEFYREIKVEKAVVLPSASPCCSHGPQSVEELVFMAKNSYPWMIPFCNIDPRMVTNNAYSDGMERIVKYYKELGCKGVGEVCANLWFDDPFMLNLFAACQEYEMPLTFHISPKTNHLYGIADDPGLPRFELCLKIFKKLKFLGHSQAFWSEMGELQSPEDRGGYPKNKIIQENGEVREGRLPKLFRKYPNLYGDLSAGSGFNALNRDRKYAARFMEEFQDRLLFGIDICAPRNFDFARDYVKFLVEMRDKQEISEQAFEKIARENAVRLLNL